MSEMFSTPERAHTWFIATVVLQNPRLSEEEKEEVIQMANGCYEYATTPPWTDPAGLFEHGTDDAAQYMNCLRNSILSVTNDEGIINVLEAGAAASADQADPPDSLLNQAERMASGKEDIVPKWMYAAVGLAVLVLVLKR